jgi:uncharacterized protein YydD (DUF2326 family)
MQGKKALDEYAALAKHIASLEEERDRIRTFLDFQADMKQRIQEIKERMVADDRKADDYLSVEPQAYLSKQFSDLARMFYPNAPAEIVINANVGANKRRYDIAAQIEGDGADGLNSARVLCFDWICYMHGSNHNMDCLWHDHRMFTQLDPKARSLWFSHVRRSLAQTRKQYVASINAKNFESMKEHMTNEDWKALNDSIQLRLEGDAAENKLLGLQFGSSSSKPNTS